MFRKKRELPSPEEFKAAFPVPPELAAVKARRDEEIRSIFTSVDSRFVLIIGPCSADNADAVCDYVGRLAAVQEKVKEKILLIPRIYTNKPRTNGQGYKGMLHQPRPEAESDLYGGMVAIRQMHLRAIRESGLTAADEMLYPENIPFLDDLLSYHAVGARSVEDQLHRLAASGIDAPVGMKNPTSGDFTVMFNSIQAAQSGHIFLFRQEEVETDGNDMAHAILRGSVSKHGESIPNYHYEDLMRAHHMYKSRNLRHPAVIVDLNHSNSNKLFQEQPRIAKEIMHNRRYSPELERLVKGMMIESYIAEGSQGIGEGVYGRSITDPCLGWVESEKLIYRIAEYL